MRSMIRAEFDKGRAPLFIFAGALFSFLLSLPFPVWFAPFVSALFLYPVFFYYVRRQKFFMTLISIVFWSSIHFVFTAFFYLLFPGFMEGRIESVTSAIKPGGLLVGEPFLDLIAAPVCRSSFLSFTGRFIGWSAGPRCHCRFCQLVCAMGGPKPFLVWAFRRHSFHKAGRRGLWFGRRDLYYRYIEPFFCKTGKQESRLGASRSPFGFGGSFCRTWCLSGDHYGGNLANRL